MSPKKTINRKKKNYWKNLDRCKLVALKYRSRNDFFVKERSCYSACSKYGWLDIVCSHMIRGRLIWTKEKENKYKQKINNLGKKNNPPFEYVRNLETTGETGLILIEIKNCENGIIKKYPMCWIFYGKNPFFKPFAPNKRTDQEVKSLVNKIGKKSNPPFSFVRITECFKCYRLVEIQNDLTKEKLVRRTSSIFRKSNPWTDSHLPLDIVKKRVNLAGKKSKTPFVFVKDTGKKNKNGIRLIEVEHKITKEKTISSMNDLCHSKIKWNRKYSDVEMKNIVNKMGNKASPKFCFVKSIDPHLNYSKIKIKLIGSKKTAKTRLSYVMSGSNPFIDFDYYEKNVLHKKFKRILLKNEIKFDYEFSFLNRSRVDFVLNTKSGKKVLVEIKNDNNDRGTVWAKRKILNQKNNYIKQGKLIFKKKIFRNIHLLPKRESTSCYLF